MKAIVGMSVILNDGETAVLFAAWTEKDVEAEIAEHFPDGNPQILLCPRWASDLALSGWPRHPDPLPVRKHTVPVEQVAHILPIFEKQIGGTGDGA
jgi:hypothetical protein